MRLLKKILIILTIASTIGGSANLALAHCGRCGIGAKNGHKHEHEKKVCEKCNHEKSCVVENCQDAAHKEACICPKKQEETQE